MKKEFLECGKIVTTHGIAGEIKLNPWCDSPEELLDIETFYLDEGKTPVKATRVRAHKNMAIIKLEGYDGIEASQALRGKVLYARRSDFPLEEGQYFISDIIGLTVVDADDNHEYGKVCEVSSTGANDVYHIAFLDGSIKLIPVIKQVIISTDIDAGVLKIRPLAGLFDDED